MGDDKYLHDQTSILGKILQINEDLKLMIITERVEELAQKDGEKGKRDRMNELKAMKTVEMRKCDWIHLIIKKSKSKPEFINKWLELQDAVNCYMDATKSSKASDKDLKGVRQIL